MCGIVGVISQAPANQLIYDALLLLQHRGQDAAGIVTMQGTKCFMLKARGMVRDVFRTRNMRGLPGHIGLGQVRYPTAGNAYSEEEAQPFYVNAPFGIVLVHNGNLTNAHALKDELFAVDRRHINTGSDTEVLINVLAHELEMVARNLPLTHDLEMFTSPGGYIGLAKIEDGMVNICGLFKARPARGAKGSALLLTMLRESSLHALADRLEAADLDESSFCGVSGFQTGLQAGPASSIGDAASMIPPFTGNGMSMAFESAECALQPALDYAAGRKSWLEAAEASTASQASRFKRRLTTATILHHLLMNRVALRITRSLARRKMMPFQTLLHLVR
jgi:hypothetical protein